MPRRPRRPESGNERKEEPDESARVPRPGPACLGRSAGSRARGADRRHRPDRLVDDLRDRPPHPQGDVPTVKPGTILGHEAVGTVVEIGSAVTTVEPGDRVLVSCITSCGRCRFCKEGHYGLCTGGGGWIFGHLIDGLQAELARVPFADTSVYKVPDELSD